MSWFLISVGSTLIFILWYLEKKTDTHSYEQIIKELSLDKKYFPCFFWIGFAILEFCRIDLRSSPYQQSRVRVIELLGEEKGELYQYICYGACLSYSYLLIFSFLLLGAIRGDLVLVIFGGVLATLPWIYFRYEIMKRVKERREEISQNLGSVLFTLTLLMKAGLVLRLAFKKVAFQNNGALYKEMQYVTVLIDNGESERTALQTFAKRCGGQELYQFTSIIAQNLEKGSQECINSLKELSQLVWEEKKTRAERKGELASQKLLIPITLSFIGILIIIIVPLWSSLYQY